MAKPKSKTSASTNDLLARLKKNSTIEDAEALDTTDYFDIELVDTGVYALNIALSGDLEGGLSPGGTIVAGPSKNFKSGLALCLVKAYMEKHSDSVCLFYDSEGGSGLAYFKSFNIDMGRVLHVPVMNLEEFKVDLVTQLENMGKEDKVIIMVDSIGMMASKKEIRDTLDNKDTQDMTRAKVGKSVSRMITPYLLRKKVPLVMIGHTYDTMEMFSKQILSGGKGWYYLAQNIILLGRRQVKTGTEVTGYDFMLNVEKSRFAKEKSTIPLGVSFGKGINKYSGILEIALASGHAVKPNNGWYQYVDSDGVVSEKKYREDATSTKEFMEPIVSNPAFVEYVKSKYQIANVQMISDQDIIAEFEEVGIEDEA